jgi:DNA mismatch endonuclease, patch repair protein
VTKRTFIRDGRAPIPKSEAISRVMSANKGKNTSLELKFKKVLRAAKISGWRSHGNLPGRPDIIFPKEKLAVFVNGCFWHACPKCNLVAPKANRVFWKAKFDRNRKRDSKKLRELHALGWRTLVFWECELNQAPRKAILKLDKLIF